MRQDDASTTEVNEGGQIEVAAGTELDYETKSTYTVTVTVEDSFGLTASIPVTIMVTDVDEKPEISLFSGPGPRAPMFPSASTSRSVPREHRGRNRHRPGRNGHRSRW